MPTKGGNQNDFKLKNLKILKTGKYNQSEFKKPTTSEKKSMFGWFCSPFGQVNFGHLLTNFRYIFPNHDFNIKKMEKFRKCEFLIKQMLAIGHFEEMGNRRKIDRFLTLEMLHIVFLRPVAEIISSGKISFSTLSSLLL